MLDSMDWKIQIKQMAYLSNTFTSNKNILLERKGYGIYKRVEPSAARGDNKLKKDDFIRKCRLGRKHQVEWTQLYF